MLTIIVSVLAGAVVGALFRVAGLVHTIPGAITPAVIAALVTLVLLFRRVGNLVSPVVEEAQRHLQGGRRELALKSLREGLRWQRWHPLIASQLRVQIGALKYAEGDLDEAIAELEKASSRPWEAPAFLGCAYFKKHEGAPMVKAFERALKTGEKDSLAYTVYAWCLNAQSKKDAAIEVLERGLKKLPGDQRLQGSLEALKEGKKLKVAPYGDRWAAFQLDGSLPTQSLPKGARGFAQRPGFRPGFRQKPKRSKN